MSPDPLLNSGWPSNPQTWNRYAYALNNPLAVTDPTGLYNLVDHCSESDPGKQNKCEKKFRQHAKALRSGLSNLHNKLKDVEDPVQKARLEAALKAFGTENDGNNVNVSFGATKDGGAGETDPIYDQATNSYSGFNVTLDPNMIDSSDVYAIDAAHEGTHVSDYTKYELNPATMMTAFQIEYRGYETSAYAASALGSSSLFEKYGGKSYVIWNGSWSKVDANITTFLTSMRDKNGNQTHPETTPHNPQPN